jgi:peptidoglycan/LPS O-acetylase OafA/YrhL
VVRLGKISYGLYMFHFMGMLLALTLLHPVSRGQLLASRVLGFAFTLVLAMASYRWVESPFLRLKDRFATVLSRPV